MTEAHRACAGTAGLLLAHETDFEFLVRRIRLYQPYFDKLFVHFDGERSVEEFAELRARLREHVQVSLLDERVSVHWGGDDMVMAMILLLQTASADPDLQYFFFLSATHYPLVDVDRFREVVGHWRGRSQVESKSMPTSVVAKRLLIPFDKTRRRSVLTPRALLRNSAALVRFMARHGWPRWGSQWCVVARQDLSRVFRSSADVCRGAYRHWKILDEVFFSTVLRETSDCRSPTYCRFLAGNSGSPEELHVDDLAELSRRNPDKTWARKVLH